MGEPVKKIPQVELVWDKKRILIAMTVLLLIVAGVVYFAENFALGTKENQGYVAGTATQEEEEKPITLPQKEDFEKRIETIRKEIIELKPQDLTQQESVKKIITELEILKKSTETQVVGGTKDMICEQAKSIFCGQ